MSQPAALSVKLNRPGYPVASISLLLSVVMSVADEEGNILPLAAELTAALDALPAIKGQYEIIFVDDQSRDNTREEILEAMQQFPQLRLIRHEGRYGKSQGIHTGVRHAHGAWIVTMDGDGQNDPADIKRLMAVAWENGMDGNMLVSGMRVNRQADAGKRLASRTANAIRRTLLQDNCPDTGCALKMFRRDAYLALPYFDNMHRYEPALFQLYNIPVSYIPVQDRPRTRGVSKYTNLKRALEGVYDLIGVMWLQRRFRGRRGESVELRLPARGAADIAAE